MEGKYPEDISVSNNLCNVIEWKYPENISV